MIKKISLVLLMMLFCFPASYAQKNFFKGLMKKVSESKTAIYKAASDKFPQLFGKSIASKEEMARMEAQRRLQEQEAQKRAELERYLKAEREARLAKERQEQEQILAQKEKARKKMEERRMMAKNPVIAIERDIAIRTELFEEQLSSEPHIFNWMISPAQNNKLIQEDPRIVYLTQHKKTTNAQIQTARAQSNTINAARTAKVANTYAKVREAIKNKEAVTPAQYKIWSQEQAKQYAVALIGRSVPKSEIKNTFIGFTTSESGTVFYVNGANEVARGIQNVRKYVTTLQLDWLAQSPLVDGRVILDVPQSRAEVAIYDNPAEAIKDFRQTLGDKYAEREFSRLRKAHNLDTEVYLRSKYGEDDIIQARNKALQETFGDELDKTLLAETNKTKIENINEELARIAHEKIMIDFKTEQIAWKAQHNPDYAPLVDLKLLEQNQTQINQMLKKEVQRRNNLVKTRRELLLRVGKNYTQINKKVPTHAKTLIDIEKRQMQAVEAIRQAVPPAEYKTTFKLFQGNNIYVNGENDVLVGLNEIKRYITTLQLEWLTEKPIAAGHVLLEVPFSNSGYKILK